jgi:hypothetical protein
MNTLLPSDASMELRRNETGLSLHYRSVSAPGAKKFFDLFRINVELVDQDDGSPVSFICSKIVTFGSISISFGTCPPFVCLFIRMC